MFLEVILGRLNRLLDLPVDLPLEVAPLLEDQSLVPVGQRFPKVGFWTIGLDPCERIEQGVGAGIVLVQEAVGSGERRGLPAGICGGDPNRHADNQRDGSAEAHPGQTKSGHARESQSVGYGVSRHWPTEEHRPSSERPRTRLPRI